VNKLILLFIIIGTVLPSACNFRPIKPPEPNLPPPGLEVDTADGLGDVVYANELEDPETPKPAAENYTVTLVDGRKSPGGTYQSPKDVANPTMLYTDPGSPPAFHPESAMITVRAVVPTDTNFAADIPKGINAVLFQEGASSTLGGVLSRAMMRKGLKLVDREDLEVIQRELILQSGYPDTSLSNLRNAGYLPENQPIESGTELGYLPQDHPYNLSTLLSSFRSPHPFSWIAPWWKWNDGSPTRLVSGNNVNEENKIEEAHILPAEALFKLLQEDSNSNSKNYLYRRPTAESIPYKKVVLEDVQYQFGHSGNWKSDPFNDFHFTCVESGSFFDPLSQSLWSITEAFVGKEVTREEYLANRITLEFEHCESCRRLLETTTVPLDAEKYPVTWLCKTCQDGKSVRYFDGYRYAGDRGYPLDQEKAIVHWAFKKLRPGIYPILSPGNIEGINHGVFLFESKAMTAEALSDHFAPRKLAEDNDFQGWALVHENKSVLTLSSEQHLSFTGECGESAFPSVNAKGEQLYTLSEDPYRTDTLSLPYAEITATVRMINTEESRLCLQGWLHRNYFHVMPDSVTIVADADGPNLSTWPNLSAQQAMVRTHIAETILNQF